MADDIFDQAAKAKPKGDIFDQAVAARPTEAQMVSQLPNAAQQAKSQLAGIVQPMADQRKQFTPMQVSSPATVPNVRIRNLTVDPSVDEQGQPLSPGRALYEGAKTGAALSSIPAMAAAPLTTLKSLPPAIVGSMGASAAAKYLGAGPFGQEVSGDVGGLIAGGLTAGKGPAVREIAGKIYTVDANTGAAELSPWAEALSHPRNIPKAVLTRIAAEAPTGPSGLTAAERAELESRAQDLMRRGRQQDILDRRAAIAAKAAAKAAPQPSPFAGMTSTAGAAPPVAAAQTMPKGSPTPFVSKFTPPEPSRIVSPDSPPPMQKVTYQSYPREMLYNMARKGDIQAGLELIRNPKGFELPPNFKFLIEETAKKLPWRNPEK